MNTAIALLCTSKPHRIPIPFVMVACEQSISELVVLSIVHSGSKNGTRSGFEHLLPVPPKITATARYFLQKEVIVSFSTVEGITNEPLQDDRALGATTARGIDAT